MSERSNFENEWRSVFDGAVDQPSSNVWVGVKSELTAMNAENQKKKLIYWRRFGVAASVTIVMLLAAFGYQWNNNMELQRDSSWALSNRGIKDEKKEFNNSGDQGASLLESSVSNTTSSREVNSTSTKETKDGKLVKEENLNNNPTEQTNLSKNEKTLKGKNPVKSVVKNNDYINSNGIEKNNTSLISVNEVSLIKADDDYRTSNKSLNSDDPIYLIAIDSLSVLAQIDFDFQLQKVPDLSKLYNFKKEDIQKDMWAGLSMGGGNFNPNVTNSNSNTALFANNEAMDLSDPNLTAANQSKISSLTSVSETPSVAYNVGLGFGKYLSKRWLLESGVEYTKYSSEAKSNLSYNKDQNSTAFVWNTNGSDFSFDNLENTTTYTLSNNYEYVSIPINFGYVLLKKQIGIIVTSGFATDLFLSNKVVDQSGNLETNVQRNGDASPFRPININALVGGELFYTWNQHYVISIDPGYRYSLTGITKSDTQFSSRPTSLFIGFKFKYLIN